MADFQVNIDLDPTTAKALEDQNFYLYGFKAVQTTQGGGAPTVWFKSDNFAPKVTVKWQETYQAYVSSIEITPMAQITATGTVDIDLGQAWQVDNVGTGPVVNQEPETAISIANQDTKPWTTGIAQTTGGETNMLCAFPLNGMGLDVIAPINKVLLMFATNQLNTGTVIFQSFSPSILIDLTASNVRDVSYEINNGWDWGNQGWGREFPASTDIVPFLIETNVSVPDASPKATEGRVVRRSLVS